MKKILISLLMISVMLSLFGAVSASSGDINVQMVDIGTGVAFDGTSGEHIKLWGWSDSVGGWVIMYKDIDANGWATWTTAEIAAEAGNGFHYNVNCYADGSATGAYSKVIDDNGFWGQFIDYDSNIEKTYIVKTPSAMDVNQQVVWNGANSEISFDLDVGDYDDSHLDWDWDYLYFETSQETPCNSGWGDKPIMQKSWLGEHGYTYDDGGVAVGEWCYLTLEKVSEGYSETFGAKKTGTDDWTVYLAQQQNKTGEKANGVYDKVNKRYTLTFDPTNVFDPGNAWTPSPSMVDGETYYAVLRMNLLNTPEAGLSTTISPGSHYGVFHPIEGPIENTNTGEKYYSIQAAIDAANPSDTINVAAGTYVEQIIIDKSITLQGASKETTIIEYPPAPVSDQYLVMVQADDVTITGFKLLGHFDTGNRAAYIVHSQGTGLIVEDNEIQGFIGIFGNLINAQIRNNIIGTNRKGIYVPGGNNLLIEGNTIEPAEGASSYAYNCGAIYMDHVTEVTIQGNTMRDFSSSVDPGITAGRCIEGSDNSHITIFDNTFENTRDAITMWIVTDIEIDGNTIANSDRYGINIKGQNLNIINNEITGSGNSGVRIDEFTITTQNVNVNFNNIVGNTNYGIKNQWSGKVNAEYNWWGHASGPSGQDGRTNPAGRVIGRGDAVIGNVDWGPWLPLPVGLTPFG